MKNFQFSLLFVLCLSSLFLTGGSNPAAGQSPEAAKPASKEILSKIIRAKRQTGPFVLLTPKDLAGISPTELSLMLGGDPCETAAPINIGQTINGELTTQDCVAPDFSYADFYRFQGQANQHIALRLNSTAIDAYLGIAEEFGDFVREDDDGGDGTNSLIQVVLPSTGPYIILANSALPNQFGPYTLSLSLIVPCSFSLDPGTISVPPLGGQFTFTVNTQQGCNWGFINSPSFGTMSQYSGTGTTTVTMTVGINDTNSTREGYVNVSGNILTVTQTSLSCNASISPDSISLPGTASNGQFAVTIEDGCSWGLLIGLTTPWIQSTTPPGLRGSGIMTFQVSPYYGTNTRTGLIAVRNKIFTITQTGLNCTYSISPSLITAPAAGAQGVITVNTQPGCPYTMGSSFMFQIHNVGQPPPSGQGEIQYTILPNPNSGPRGMTATFYGGGVVTIPVTFWQAGTSPMPISDYDGDRRSDLSVRRPSDGIWYILRGTAGYMGMAFGEAGDSMVPADYDGDGKTDVAMFRGSNSTWYIFNSGSQSFQEFTWGVAGDIPVPADHDGDGKADLVIFRPSTGTWYTRFSNNSFSSVTFGAAGDKPVVGDFDGDGKSDVAVYRPSDGNWHILKTGFGYFAQTWGVAGDIPVPADYDGDGKTDVAIWRPSTGEWYRIRSSAGFDVTPPWGVSGDIPVPADYDGDGNADVAVFRPSNGTWYIIGTTGGQLIQNFGQDGDVPTQSAFIY